MSIRKPSPFLLAAIAGIVAVLAYVAIPADALYVPRMKLKEVEATVHACRDRVAAFVAAAKRLPRDAREAGCDESPTARTERIEVAGAEVKVKLRRIDRSIDGRYLSYQGLDEAGNPADGARPPARWRCSTDADLGNPLIRAFPQECRQAAR
jgi:hypothetical protein